MAATEKDKQIIRQSQLKFVMDYFQMCGLCPSLADVIKVTSIMEKFVIEGYSKSLKESYDRIDQYIDSEYRGS